MTTNRRTLPSADRSLPARSLAARGLALLAAGVAFGCTETTAPAADFTVKPDTASIFVGGAVQLTALNAPGEVTWSSSNSQVASVVSVTGYVQGLTSGQVTISAVSGAALATAEVTVLRPPELALSTTDVAFAMLVGGADPASRTVTIENAGDGAVDGVSLGGVTYDEGQPTGWLSASLGGSSAPTSLTLSASGAALPRGVYTASLPVDADVDNAPIDVAVTLRVETPASIEVSRASVPMAAIPSSVVTETVDVTNGGDRPLTDLTAQVAYAGGQPTGWLDAALGATSAPATLTLTASIGDLPVGAYDATVTVASGAEGAAPVDLAVHLTVNPGPAISLSRTAVTLQAPIGTDPPPSTVSVTNGGGGTLSGLTLGAVQYPQDGPGGWLSTALGGGTAPATITLTAAASALAEGSYSAIVPVESPVASNAPVNLEVTLEVTPTPILVLNRSALDYDYWRGAALPASRTIRVTNGAGDYPLTGLSYSISYSAGASGWLDVAWEGGSTDAPATLVIQPSRDLAEGSYTATVTVDSDVSGVTAQTATVSYRLRSFPVTIHPDLGPSCGGCHYAPGGQAPVLTGTAANTWSILQGYLIPGNPTSSSLYRVISGLTGHSGGTFAGLSNLVYAWILAGAPYP